MSVISKIFTFSFLILIAFALLNPSAAYAHNGGSVDHTNHTESASSAAVYYQTNCASVCARNARTVHSDVILKESERKTEKQQQTKPETTKKIRENTQPNDQKAPKTVILPDKEIYKFTCAYLF